MYSDGLTQEEITAGFLNIQPFISYDLTGRITGSGEQGLFATLDFASKGRLVMPGRGHWKTHYVALEEGVIYERQPLPTGFDKTTIPVNTEATLLEVPECSIGYTGPISGSLEHKGGNLDIGFSIPGSYKIEFEPFPYLPVSLELTVTP